MCAVHSLYTPGGIVLILGWWSVSSHVGLEYVPGRLPSAAGATEEAIAGMQSKVAGARSLWTSSRSVSRMAWF